MTPLSEASKYLDLPFVSPCLVIKDLEAANLIREASQGLEKLSDTPAKIVVDSRKVEEGCIYIAIKGSRHDGHDGVEAAIRAGARLVITESFIKTSQKTPQCVVTSSRRAWAWACSTAWGHPGNDIALVGVTGTNGKTSTVWMIRAILMALNIPTAAVGTLGFYVDSTLVPTVHTTPDPDVLYGLMRLAVNQGCKVFAMEVSSHSLTQGKISPLRFDCAAFTSFSQDHLDLHKTMEDYLEAKLSLFKNHLKKSALAIIHESVKHEYNVQLPQDIQQIIYGEGPSSDVNVSFALSPSRSSQRVHIASSLWPSFDGNIPFIGGMFSLNFAAAFIASRSISEKFFSITWPNNFDSLLEKTLSPVPGRLSPIFPVHKSGSQSATVRARPLVLVDYAHTPDALEKSLLEARKVTPRRLICVFGCGGDRDRSKRPLMGAIAKKLSDVVIVTNDNPRSEAAEEIVAGILRGGGNESTPVSVILDRKAAIEQAITCAAAGDTVLIAGKGHENYQIIGSEVLHFSDSEVSSAALSLAKKWCVIGAGISGVAASELLVKSRDFVQISDGGVVSEVTRGKLGGLGIQVLDKGHALNHLDGIQGLVLSPGVPRGNILVVEAAKRHLGFCTEIDIGLEGFEGHMIAVTGTNGKSTTCALFEHALTALGRKATACGNIGLPPSAISSPLKDHASYLVCELSSYQLEDSLAVKSEVAVITSFSFDHIARHGSLQNYFECKWRVTEGLKPGGLLILRGDVYDYAKKFLAKMPREKTIVVHDHRPAAHLQRTQEEHWWPEGVILRSFAGDVCRLSDYKLAGVHNAVNAAFVVAGVSHQLKMPYEDVAKTLCGFLGLPFRCQIVGTTARGFDIVNDSKSTNVESTVIALSASKEPVILLIGGAGKGESFEPLLKHKDRIHRVIAFGASRSEIASDLSSWDNVSSHKTLKEAVGEAMLFSRSVDASVLLSPACASFDEFKNYEDRGRKFNEWILTASEA